MVNTVHGTVSGPVVQAGVVEGGVHQHFGTRAHVVQPFPVPATPSSSWLMAQPSRLLDARSQVVPFVGRDDELLRLREWRDSESPFSVLLLHGPGGQGKTRLAAEFAERSRGPHWDVLQAGFQAVPGGNEVPRLADAGTLLVVDYADRWAHSELTRLLSDPVLRRRPRVRILLIGRTVRWYAAIRGELADMRASAEDLALPALTTDRVAMFRAALERYARPDLYDVADPADIRPPGSLEHRDFGLTLTLHMAALVAVDAHQRGERVPAGPHELSAYLLDREHLAWQRLYDAGRQGQDYRTRPSDMARAVFTSVLTGPVEHPAGLRVVRALDLPGHPLHLLDDHRFCYPPADRESVLEPLYPDRLAEDFLALLTPGHDISSYEPDPWATTVPATLLAADGAVAPRAVTFLASAAGRWPHLGEQVLYPLLREDPGIAVSAGSAALAAIAAVEDLPDDVLLSIDTQLPEGRHVDLDVGAAAVSEVLTERMLQVIGVPEARAQVLANHSERLAAAGRHDDALEHSRRSLELCAALAEIDRAVHLPALAAAANNHATRLRETGHHTAALAFSERAVVYATELVEHDRATHLPSLVASMLNHAVLLTTTGRHTEAQSVRTRAAELRAELPDTALRAAGTARIHSSRFQGAGNLPGTDLKSAQDAVAYHSALADVDRAAHLPELAASVNNLTVALAEDGRSSEALVLSEQAVGLREELVAANRAAHLPGLAASLHNHANRLAEADRLGEALATAERAVELREELTGQNRALHLPDLAASEFVRAMYLAKARRVEEALAVSRHAVGHFAELAEEHRAAHLPALTSAVVNHAALAELSGRSGEALDHSRRAVELCEELTRHDRATHLPGLAASLRTHVRRLADGGQETSEFSRRIVEVYGELAEHDRAAYLHDAAMAAGYHATRLGEAGRFREALEYSRRAIDLLTELAEQNRTRYLPTLAQLMGDHETWLVAEDRAEEALAWSQRLAELREDLAQRHHLPGLAEAVHHHAAVLEENGQHDEALEEFQRAVGLMDELAAADRGYLPMLAHMVLQQSVRLARAARSHEALAMSQRAVDLTGELADFDPGTYLQALADGLHAFMVVRAAAGEDLASAAQAGARAVELYRELAAAEPAVFDAQLQGTVAVLATVRDALEGR